MRKSTKQSILFIVLVYFLSWIFWIPLIGNNEFFISKNLLLLIGIYMPSIIGILMTKAYSKKSSLMFILKALFKFKIGIKEYFIIFSYFPLIIGLAFGFMNIIEIHSLIINYPIRVFPLVFFYILILQGPLGEEFGWRGFLMKQLMTSYNAIFSSLLVGLIWSLWHLPLFFIHGTIQFQIIEKFSLIPTLSGYLLYTILISMLISIVFIRNKNSVWTAILFHTIANTTIGYAPIIMTVNGSFVLLTVLLAVTIVSVKFNRKILMEN